MNRRSFLSIFGLGASALAAEQAIPFGRVWSFPSKMVIPKPLTGTIVAYRDFASTSDLIPSEWHNPWVELHELERIVANNSGILEMTTIHSVDVDWYKHAS